MAVGFGWSPWTIPFGPFRMKRHRFREGTNLRLIILELEHSLIRNKVAAAEGWTNLPVLEIMAALIERDKNLTSFVVRLLSWQSHLSERQQTSRVKPSQKRANILQSLNVHNLASAERFQTRMQMNKPQRIDWVMILLPTEHRQRPTNTSWEFRQ